MDKVGRPRGLIAYDTLHNLEAAGKETIPIKLLRPRAEVPSTFLPMIRSISVALSCLSW